MERETGIEPATNNLEGCDSTIELLPLEARCYFYCRERPSHGQRDIIPALPSDPICPHCGSADVHRSARRGWLDWLFRAVFCLPFRCHLCSTRFYRPSQWL